MTLLLLAHAHPTVAARAHPNLGRLVQPRHLSSVEATARSGIRWAADNDCYQGLDHGAYYGMLDRLRGLPGCLFVTVPDVVGDALATARRFEAWSIGVERRGLPLALVLQDGIEDHLGWYGYHFHRLAAVFVGGTTHWKMGPVAAALARHAHAHGRWVHWGRVNTARRLMYVKSTGACDSFDGTKWARWRDVYLDTGLALASAPQQIPL